MRQVMDTFGGFTAIIEEADETVQCWVSKHSKGQLFTASLAAAGMTGELEDRDGNVLPIPDDIVHAIEGWAEKHGY